MYNRARYFYQVLYIPRISVQLSLSHSWRLFAQTRAAIIKLSIAFHNRDQVCRSELFQMAYYQLLEGVFDSLKFQVAQLLAAQNVLPEN